MSKQRGNPTLDQVRNENTDAANKRRRELTDHHAWEMAKALRDAYTEGVRMPYSRFAEWLNENGHRTRRGGLWTSRAVSRLFKKVTSPVFVKAFRSLQKP